MHALRSLTVFLALGVSMSITALAAVPATPVFGVPGGTYKAYQSVTIKDATAGATIYFTVTGVTPTIYSTKYSGPVDVNRNMTLKAIAVVSGSTSAVASATYKFVAPPAPVFSVPAGTYHVYKSVKLKDSAPGVAIYYTVTGVDPTIYSTQYAGPIEVNRNMTLRAIAAYPGGSVGPITSAEYKFVAPPAPTFSVPGGSYWRFRSVTIHEPTHGAAIYYTVTGVKPTIFSTRYTGPVEVNRRMTLQAIAVLPGGPPSRVTSASYTFHAALPPTFNRVAGAYQGQQLVTIKDTTPGAAIYFTVTGVKPTVFSTRYFRPIPVTRSMTLRAIAAIPGGRASLPASVALTILPHSNPLRTPNTRSSFFGMNVDHLVAGTPWPELPVSILRLWDSGTKWANLSPAPGTYHWNNLDLLLNMARANNSQILYTLGGVPPWALPKNVPIKSIVRSHGVVTVTTETPHGMYFMPSQPIEAQSQFTVAGVANGTFNGTFTIAGTPTPDTITFSQPGPNASSSSGRVSAVCGGVYAPGVCAEAPADINQWDDYITQIINHVGPGAIKYWEYWNEANDPIYWRGDPKLLVTMAEHARSIIRAADPAAVFLSPSVTGTYETEAECAASVRYCGTTWLDNWLALGGTRLTNVISVHAYSPLGLEPEQIQNDIYQLESGISRHGASSLPVWDTESSWRNNANIPKIEDQAAWLARHFMLEQSIGIQRTFWYAYDTPTWGTLWTKSRGLNYAGTVYAEVAKWITGVTLTQPCAAKAHDPTTYECNYTRPNGYVARAVWNTKSKRPYKVPSEFVQYRDISGNVHGIGRDTVVISTTPILLENKSVF